MSQIQHQNEIYLESRSGSNLAKILMSGCRNCVSEADFPSDLAGKRRQSRLKNEFIIHHRISRYSKVFYFALFITDKTIWENSASFPGSLILPFVPGGGKMRDPGNEVGEN